MLNNIQYTYTLTFRMYILSEHTQVHSSACTTLVLSFYLFFSLLLMALQFSPEQPGQWGQRLVLFAEELNRDSGESRGAKHPPDFKADAGCPVCPLVPGHKLSSMQPGTN